MATGIRQIKGLKSVADPRAREVVLELCRAIQAAFPEAEFAVYPNPEHRGAIIRAYTDSDDMDTVLDRVINRVVDLLVEEDISVRVQPRNRKWLHPGD